MAAGEILAIIISFCSLLVTTILAIIQLISNNKNNAKNLRANLVKDMYEKPLMVSIPQGREYIHYNGKRITGVDHLIDAISGVRRSSLYFKAADNEYYNKIRGNCQKLEDFLNGIDKDYSSTEFNEFMNGVDNMINEIYTIISEQYSGK